MEPATCKKELVALEEDVRRLDIAVDEWWILCMDVVERDEDVREHPEDHGIQCILPLEPLSSHIVAEAAFVNRHEDFNEGRVIESLTSLIRYNMLHDVL